MSTTPSAVRAGLALVEAVTGLETAARVPLQVRVGIGTGLVRLLDVIAGVDSADPATAEAEGEIPSTYMAFLNRDAAMGRRIAVLRQACRPDASDPQVLVIRPSCRRFVSCGGEDHRSFHHSGVRAVHAQASSGQRSSSGDRTLSGEDRPTFPKTLSDIMASGKFHPLHEVGLLETSTALAPDKDPVVEQLEADEARMRIAYLGAMDEMRIDVLAIPTATYPPRVNGDRDMSTAGTRSGIASALRWPAAVVPMGYTYENLPSGLQFIGRPWSEPILIEIAYAYEQVTQHRVPPSTVPPLRD